GAVGFPSRCAHRRPVIANVRTMSLFSVIAIGLILSATVFAALAMAILGVLRIVIAPTSRHPKLPRVLGLVAALILSLPSCVLVIEHTPLKELSWGHAGEFLLMPFVVANLIMFPVLMSFIGRRSSPNRTVDPDARKSSARGSP